jgi:ATP-dependent RNA helicase RhlE
VLVFTRMKHGANRLAEFLNKQDITAMAIHGNKSQGARTKALSEFKTGTLQVLVATDIAARGIDIDELPHVVNFELPNVPEDYVHRIGRTGRAGCEGEAVSLVCPDEELFLKDIEKLIKRTLNREVLPGFEVPSTERAEPIQIGRQTIGVRGQGRSGGGGARPARDGQAPRRDGGRPPAPRGAGPKPARTGHGSGHGHGGGDARRSSHGGDGARSARPSGGGGGGGAGGSGRPAALLGGPRRGGGSKG